MPAQSRTRIPTWIQQVGAVALLFVVAGAVAASSVSFADAANQAQMRRISISATGMVNAPPDRAIFSLGVISRAETAGDALSENSKAMRNIIDGMKAAGIAAEDLQTSRFSIQPVYERVSRKLRSNGPTVSRNRIVAFEARNGVMVLVRDLKKLGELLDQGSRLGANEFGNVRFIVSNANRLRDTARKDAVAKARARAELYADAAGVKLGNILSLSESGGRVRPMVAQMSARSEAMAVPVEAGTQSISVRVSIVWELE